MNKENISDKPIDVLNIQKVLFIINNDYKWELFVKDAYGMSQDISLTDIINKIKLEKYNSPSDYYKKNHSEEDTESWNKLTKNKKQVYLDKFYESQRKYAYDIILIKKYLFYYIKEDLNTIYETIDIYINDQLILAYENGNELNPEIYREKWSKLSQNIKNKYEDIRNKLLDILKNSKNYSLLSGLNYYQKLNSSNINSGGKNKMQIQNQNWNQLSDDEKFQWKQKALISNIENERQMELKNLYIKNCIKFSYSNEFDLFYCDFKKYYTPSKLAKKYWEELSNDIKNKYKNKFHRLLISYKFKLAVFKNYTKNTIKKSNKKQSQQKKNSRKKKIKHEDINSSKENNKNEINNIQFNINRINVSDDDENLVYTKPPNALTAFALYLKYNFNKIVKLFKSKDKITILNKGAEIYNQLDENDKRIYINLQKDSQELYNYRLDSFNKYKYYDANKSLASYKKDEEERKQIDKIFDEAFNSIDKDDINDIKDLDQVSLYKHDKVERSQMFKSKSHICSLDSIEKRRGNLIELKKHYEHEPLDIEDRKEDSRNNTNTKINFVSNNDQSVHEPIDIENPKEDNINNSNENENSKVNLDPQVNVNLYQKLTQSNNSIFNNNIKNNNLINKTSCFEDDFPPSIALYKDLLEKNSVETLLLNAFPKQIIDIYLNYLVNKHKKNNFDQKLEKLKSDLSPSANVDENNKIITDADLENDSQSNNDDIQVNNQAINDIIDQSLANISEIKDNNDDLLSDSKHYIYSKASEHNTVIDDPIDFNDYDNQYNSEERSILNELYVNKAIIRIDNDIVPINNKQHNNDAEVNEEINKFLNNKQFHININLNNHHKEHNNLLLSKTFKLNHNLNLNKFKNEEFHSKKKFVKCLNLNNILNNNNPEEYINKNSY